MRCVRRAGHAMAPAYPNTHMQKTNPDYWRALQDDGVTLTLDEICQDEIKDKDFDFEFIESEPGQ